MATTAQRAPALSDCAALARGACPGTAHLGDWLRHRLTEL